MSQKRVYLFGNGKAEGNAKMREELGGKGANLAEMNHISAEDYGAAERRRDGSR